MIKAVILDVDGVLVGEKEGYNFPFPHPDVISKLKILHKNGLHIHLCTAKPYWAVDEIVKQAELDNHHIAEGGAVLIDPIHKKILKKHIIASRTVHLIVESCLKDVYIELYNLDDYFIQRDQMSEITRQHEAVLQKKAVVVDRLSDLNSDIEVAKIMLIAHNKAEKQQLSQHLKQFENEVSVAWTIHPVALPLQFCVITRKGVSKTEGAKEIIKSEAGSFQQTAAVGDSTSDWQFIQLCSYKAAMGNATDELKSLVLKSDGFIGPSVDENGILTILNHFIPSV